MNPFLIVYIAGIMAIIAVMSILAGMEYKQLPSFQNGSDELLGTIFMIIFWPIIAVFVLFAGIIIAGLFLFMYPFYYLGQWIKTKKSE